jgi:hypothetical protein
VTRELHCHLALSARYIRADTHTRVEGRTAIIVLKTGTTIHKLVARAIRLRDTRISCGKGNVAHMATRGVEVKFHVF